MTINENDSLEIIEWNIKRLQFVDKELQKKVAMRRDEIIHDLANYNEDVGNKSKTKSLRQKKQSKRKIEYNICLISFEESLVMEEEYLNYKSQIVPNKQKLWLNYGIVEFRRSKINKSKSPY